MPISCPPIRCECDTEAQKTNTPRARCHEESDTGLLRYRDREESREHGKVAQFLVEHWSEKPGVAGSTPALATEARSSNGQDTGLSIRRRWVQLPHGLLTTNLEAAESVIGMGFKKRYPPIRSTHDVGLICADTETLETVVETSSITDTLTLEQTKDGEQIGLVRLNQNNARELLEILEEIVRNGV